MYIGDFTAPADEALPGCGESAARQLSIDGGVSLRALRRDILAAVHALSKQRNRLLSDASSKALPFVSRWLADNFYLVQLQAEVCAEAFSTGGKLPAVNGSAASVCLCRELLRMENGALSRRRFSLFFSGCTLSYVFSRAELDTLAAALNAAVILELAELYLKNDLTDEAALTAGNLFTSLRELSAVSYDREILSLDAVERILSDDPGGQYPLMSEKTRFHYRRRVAALAKRFGVSELRLAERALLSAREQSGVYRHIGFALFPHAISSQRRRARLYISCLAALTVLHALLTAYFTNSAAAFFLTLLPYFELAKLMIDRLIIAILPPRHLPRMDTESGLPPEGRTLCVISALLTRPASGQGLAALMEQYALANRDCGEGLLFGILADLPDSRTAVAPPDGATLSAARDAIEALNKKYGGGFFLFTRPRRYLKADGKFCAHERKRGAVTELCRLLSGKNSALCVAAGSSMALRGVSFLMTLDEDTRLNPGSAGQLIGAMLHPLNRPVFDETGTRVVAGHGLIQPRMTTKLGCVNSTGFSRAFAGQGGTDPYGGDVSEVFFDAFSSGGFAGKGIIDVAAYLRALDGRLPENRVLSHDALEGAYLRGALAADVELSDSFPDDALAYYRRMHRWIRGDWQNSPWIFRRGRPLSLIDRFRLWDSLRRSLMPVWQLLSLVAAFFLPSAGLRAAAVVAVASLGASLLAASLESLFHRPEERCRRISYVPSAAQSAYLQLLIKLVLLPHEAVVCLSAIVTALWRMAVSKRRLLSWTTSAAASASGAVKYLRAFWPAMLLGALTMTFSASPLGGAMGAVWIFSPMFALAISRPFPKNPDLAPESRDYLLGQARKIWSYFSELCTAREHYLPPDNFQQQPPVGAAHRTSPTNIGLSLLSALAALDLKIAPQPEALGLIENQLATLRRLAKWEGHLYNWYDTQTLRAMRPASISTVDSGNLAICLMILRQGLLEYGETGLASRCSQLLEPMSFAPLYDRSKRLLCVSLDPETGSRSENCYDLFASEARSASFVAVCRGNVPLKHWRALSRALVEFRGCRGMVSWTGSMFEYLMPALFFSSERGSLLLESEQLCVTVQKARTATSKLPWGISEGSFYALDPALNYRYAPHGCAALALHRGMDEETVVSPYSTFLALKISPEAAVENLKALEKHGLGCRYGLWEAIDFTPGRGGSDGQVVKSVMAHHLGMSLVAICNALKKDVSPDRLAQAPEAAAFLCLLEERLPLHSRVFKRRQTPAAEQTHRPFPIYWERRDTHVDFQSPVCTMLSNGVYNVMLTDSGSSRARCCGVEVYVPADGVLSERHGIDFYALQGGDALPLLPCPNMSVDASCSWQFSLSGGKHDVKSDGLRAQILSFVSEDCCGEKRVVTLSSEKSEQYRSELLVCFEPLLTPYVDYVNHPAYSKLGLHAGLRAGSIMIHRLPRNEQDGLYLCVACSEAARFSARRELFPGRGGPGGGFEGGETALGWLRDGFVCAALPVTVSPGIDHPVSIALALGDSETAAYCAAQKILTQGYGAAEFLAGRAAALHMSDAQLDLAMETLCAVCFPQSRAFSRESLWRFGISGDRPVVALDVSEDTLEIAEDAATAQSFLACAGIDYDLALVTDEGGSYLQPVGESLNKLREQSENDAIFIINSAEDASMLFAAGVQKRPRPLTDKTQRFKTKSSVALPRQSYPKWEFEPDGTFNFYVNHSMPPRVWGNMLTNSRFGYFATDCGSGHMWFENARENQLSPWNGDAFALDGEVLDMEGESLFASSTDTDCRVSFGFGFARWEKPIGNDYVNLSAFVPTDTDARVFLVQGGSEKPTQLRWYCDLALCPVGQELGGVKIVKSGDFFDISRENGAFSRKHFYVFSSADIKAYTSSRESFFSDEMDGSLSAGEGLGVEFEATLPFVLVCGCDEPEKLRALCSAEAAAESLRATRASWRSAVGRIEIKTPLHELDKLINGWIPYQTLAGRLFGRTSIYQCGGAVGFRDQLQDAVNLLLLDPVIARSQITACCGKQYTQGDVMHWWHETPDKTTGVRTRCSDDLVWLVWAVCEYVEATGDLSLLAENVQYLSSEPLGEDEHDRYEAVLVSAEGGDVLAHCRRALDLVLLRGTGSHGLLKIGSGDWNDGFSAVGIGGKGESVWLTWFFSSTAARFAEILNSLGDRDSSRYAVEAGALAAAANSAWDGDHFLRAYFDDGTPLGSDSQQFCKIDSVAQSFAALCPGADPKKTDVALSSAVARLFDDRENLVKLLDPPFNEPDVSAGYIDSYGPGFRENGGQYTHGALFLIYALLEKGRSEEAVQLLQAILPSSHDGAVYAAEPYVVAADISASPGTPGQAGWSWYTGSAGWLFRVVVQQLLGLKLKNGKYELTPRLPSDWKSCTVRIKTNGKTEEYVLSPAEPPQSVTQNL